MFYTKLGTVVLLEDLNTSLSVPEKAVFNIAFEINEDGTKTFNHEQLYNNAGELFLKGEFVINAENKNNIRLQLSLQFPEV